MKFVNLDASSAFDRAISSIRKDNKLVICGSTEDQRYLEEAMADCFDGPKEIIRKAAKVNLKAWQTERREELEQDRDFSKLEGNWQAESSDKPGFNLATDFATGELIDDLVGAKIKTDNNWKLPAHFKFGGWNSCPAPELHCAQWKQWQLKYGAQIIGISNDVIEAHVSKPPTTQEEALALAWEHYLYCPDVVEQGVESIAKLAEVLINHECWYFWWD